MTCVLIDFLVYRPITKFKNIAYVEHLIKYLNFHLMQPD